MSLTVFEHVRGAGFVGDVLDAPSLALSGFFRDQLHRGATQDDTGVTAMIWPRGAVGQMAVQPPHAETRGAGDGLQSTPELFQSAFQQLAALRFGRPGLSGEICSSPPPASNLMCFFRDRMPFQVPWLLDDGRASTTDDGDLRAAIDRIYLREARALEEGGSRRGTAVFNDQLIVRLIIAMHRDRASGGLGLRYRFEADGRYARRDGVQAYAAGEGDCNSFSFIFYAIVARAGLHPRFIRITGERNPVSQEMEELNHVGVAVQLDPANPSDWTAVDPSRGMTLAGGVQWYPVTENEMMAFHLRNLAFFNVPADLTGAVALDWSELRIRQADELAPYNFEIALDVRNFFSQRRADAATAQIFERRAADLNPSLQRIWSGTAEHP